MRCSCTTSSDGVEDPDAVLTLKAMECLDAVLTLLETHLTDVRNKNIVSSAQMFELSDAV